MYGDGSAVELPTLPSEPVFSDPIEQLKVAMKGDMFSSLKELKAAGFIMPARGIIDFKYNPEDNYYGDYDVTAKEIALDMRRGKTMTALERNR